MSKAREWWIVDGRHGEKLFDNEHEAILYAGRLAEEDPTFTIPVIEKTAHIVRCVNMHEEMLAALKGVVELIDGMDLVRNTQSDSEFLKFFDQGLRITNKLKAVADCIANAEAGE